MQKMFYMINFENICMQCNILVKNNITFIQDYLINRKLKKSFTYNFSM